MPMWCAFTAKHKQHLFLCFTCRSAQSSLHSFHHLVYVRVAGAVHASHFPCAELQWQSIQHRAIAGVMLTVELLCRVVVFCLRAVTAVVLSCAHA